MTAVKKEHEPDDAELVRRVRGGAVDEFSQLVIRYQQMVLNLMIRQTGSAETAEELAQETFLRAFQALRNFRGDAAFKSWLTRIGLNVAHSHFASKAYQQGRAAIAYDPEKVPQIDSATPQRADDRMFLRRGLAGLKPELREVVVLISLEEYSFSEAAVILKIPQGTVSSRFTAAMQRLRELLKKEEA